MKRLAPALLVLIALLLLSSSEADAQNSHKARQPPAPFDKYTLHVGGERPAEVSVAVLPTADPRHARGTLVLLHGYQMSRAMFYGYDRLRRDFGWNLVMPDFRGHGESSAAQITLGIDEVADAEATLDLCDRLGLGGPRAIYGISMGASVGLMTAAHDGRVRGVFAISPYENAFDAVGQFTRAITGWNLTRAMVPPELANGLHATDVRGALAGRDDLRISVICGGDDCFPPAMQERILAASASPDSIKSLAVGDGYTHFNIPSWDGVTPRLLKFMDDVRTDAAKGPATRPTSRPTTRPAE